MGRNEFSHIETPDGDRWYLTYHAKQRMKLYGLSFEEVKELLHTGGAEYAYTDPNMHKVYNKRLEIVVNVKLNKIITIYIRS